VAKARQKQHEVAPGVFVSSSRISQLRYPERQKARQQVRSAVRSGQLIPTACQVCQRRPTEAHHADYAKPLDVQWLCLEHHHAADRQLGRTRRRDNTFTYTTSPELHRAAASLGTRGGKARAKKYNSKPKTAAARRNATKGGWHAQKTHRRLKVKAS
jgi:hypothetical protein